jgi:beta-phosphoglucomutase
MNATSIRGIVFDMDGVLVDSHPSHRLAWKQFLESVGKTATDAELEFILDGRKRDEILRHFLGDLSSDQIREYGLRKDEMLRSLGNGIHPVEGVVEFLTSLRPAGFRTALATSAGKARTFGTLKELGLTEYFDAVITGDEVPASKPDPSIYRLAAERIEEDPKHLMAIEDAPSGVKAAMGAGLRCIGIASDARAELLRAAGASSVLPHFGMLSIQRLTRLVD